MTKQIKRTTSTSMQRSAFLAVSSMSLFVALGCSGRTIGNESNQPGTEGGDCLPDNNCNEDARCQDGVCQEVPSGTNGAPCFRDQTCTDDLLCLGGVCVERPAAGGEDGVCLPDGTCSYGLKCTEGICCHVEQSVCGNRCVDTQADAAHCGQCGNACTATEYCTEGKCEYHCYGEKCVRASIRFEMLAAGGFHTCGLVESNKRVVCWGLNDHGQAPTAPSTESFQWISAGEYHTCGVRTDGKARCWGLNADGQAPPMASSETFRVVSAGGHHTCGTQKSGKTFCWGRNTEGQAPPTVPSELFWYTSAGAYHTCGLTKDRRILCWGRNAEGQLSPPEDEWWDVSAGYDHTCAIGTEGLTCWGTDKTQLPHTHNTNTSYASVQSGAGFFCALRFGDIIPPAGPILCFGSLAPPPAAPWPRGYSQYSAGSHHGCAISGSWDYYIPEEVVCWGRNDEGQAPQ